MADNSRTTSATSTTTSPTVNPLDLAIGLSLFDALGDGGDVVARRNSSFFNNSFDAFGLPRNRFNLIQNILPRQDDSPLWGQDMRSILGGNAEIHSQSDTAFARDMMAMLFSGGIFGMIMGLNQLTAQVEAQSRQAPTQQRQPSAQGTGSGGDVGGTYRDDPGTTVVGEPTTVSASTGRVTPAVTTASAGSSDVTTTTINVPAGVTAPTAAVCDDVKADGSRACVVTRPKGPGGP